MNNDIIVIDNLQIQDLIYTIRGVQVMLDRDLAVLYQIETRALKQAVKRNISRFPPEFMFELVENEMNFLVSQSVIPSQKYFGGAKPYAFTEQGVAMLSAVLRSETAVNMSIQIINAFVTCVVLLLLMPAFFKGSILLKGNNWNTKQNQIKNLIRYLTP